MTHDEARAAIETLIANAWSATPLAYPNVAFTPPGDGGPWARLAIEPGATVQASFGGATRRFRCTGDVHFELLTATGVGSGDAYRLAGEAVALFADADIADLVFGAAATRPGRDDDSWFSVVVSVPFHHDDLR